MLQYFGDRTAIARTIRDGAAFYRENKISRLLQEGHDNGTVTLRAKAVDRFQFVLRPEVTVDPKRQLILRSVCDCNNGQGLCKHAVALLLSIGEQVGPKAAEPAAVPPQDPTADEITIRVIHEKEGISAAGVLTGDKSCTELHPEPPIRAQDTPKAPVGDTSVDEPAAASEADQAAPIPESPAPEAENEAPVFVPPGIQVQLGKRKTGEDPIFWTPNDTEQALHPNMGIIGTMGTGKTQFIKSLILQVVRQNDKNFGGDGVGILIFDYKGDYNETKEDFVRATGARVLKPYLLPYNPLAIVEPKTFKPLLPIHIANSFKDTLSKIYRLGPKQQQFLLNCIHEAYRERGIDPDVPATWKRHPPTVADVHRIFTEESAGKAPDSLAAAINKLHPFRIFNDSPVAVGSIRDLTKGVVVIDLSSYDPDIQNLVVDITLDQFYAQMLATGSSRTDGRYRELRELVLVDEADNFMKEDFPSLRKILKEGREFGVGTVLSTQSLSHFSSGNDDYSRYLLTWIVHAVSDLKQKEVEYIFKLPAKSGKTAAIYTTVKGLEKHQSVMKLAKENPVVVWDLPFWQILRDERSG